MKVQIDGVVRTRWESKKCVMCRTTILIDTTLMGIPNDGMRTTAQLKKELLQILQGFCRLKDVYLRNSFPECMVPIKGAILSTGRLLIRQRAAFSRGRSCY